MILVVKLFLDHKATAKANPPAKFKFRSSTKKLSATLSSQVKLCSSKTKLVCETSFNIEMTRLKKRSARVPSKMKH